MDSALRQPRIVLGSGRSGTTWVLDCLADANGLRPVFEPLHPHESEVAARYAYELLVKGDENEALRRYFLELASGRRRSRWIDYRAPQNLFRPQVWRILSEPAYAKRWIRRWPAYLESWRTLREAVRRPDTLIKCIRANLMAGWLSGSVGFRTALVVRHPCAVVESQYRLKWGVMWDPRPVLARYRSSRRLHELTNGRYLKILDTELGTVEALTLNWVIENQWPVERSGIDGYAVVYYEHLISDPGVAWGALCAALGLSSLPDAALLRKPSQQASNKDHSISGGLKAPGWRSRLTSEHLDAIQRVLDATHCHLYNAREVLPAVAQS